MEFADTLAAPAFREWHDKHEENSPWLTHSYVVIIHEVVRVFARISIEDFNQCVLSAGQSLPASVHQPALDVTQQIQTSLKSGLLQNSIGEFAQPPASCAFFRKSIEETPRAPQTQRTSNSPATSQRSNTPRENNTRNTQCTNIPTINVDETDWIVKITELEMLAYHG